MPLSYDATYDLHKRRDRRLSMRFVAQGGAILAERGPGDTSTKPPLAAKFRTNVIDPLSVIDMLRARLRQGQHGNFTIPVYDGARRFDTVVEVAPKTPGDPLLHLKLSLRPIAGFKGETSEDGDPDDAPRPVAVAMTDDAKLMPVRMTVNVAYLPLVVELIRWCAAGDPCGW